MNLAFDIDDTITAKPELFAALSGAAGVQTVLIVSSRGNSEESRRLTLVELEAYGIRHHGLHLLEDGPEARNRCPHPDLDWYQKYLWQKVEICLREKIDVVFEDDEKVIDLFRRFAPKIRVMPVHRAPPVPNS
ncbi:MAG: HAD family hydrolase [Verrucomicrobiales bacterium]|nr:HAD family hydrolase [Verrucomicrobiales bacterium]